MWTPNPRSTTFHGLRTRYVPRSRIGQGLLSAAPYLNIVLLLLFFLMVRDRLVIEPGFVLDVPSAPFSGGERPDLAAVVMSLQTQDPATRDEIVLFRDQSYHVNNQVHMDALRIAIGAAVRRREARSLMLEADRRVQHGTLIQLCDLARGVGLESVNLAARPSDEDGAP